MLRSLNAGAINVSVKTLADGIEACKIGGFNALELNPQWVESTGVDETKAALSSANIAPGGWGLPVEWRHDKPQFLAGLEKLPAQADLMAAIGCDRCMTWVLSGSNERNWDQNWAFHVRRFKQIADILADRGIRLGLEFIGTKTLRDMFRHPFVYTSGEMMCLAREIGPNVGLLLDCWHWYASEGNTAELNLLNERDVVYVHVNDAPAGVTVDDQKDNVRLLPGESGVIDLDGFFGALKGIGYDGPVCVEPFKDALKDLATDADRLKMVGDSLRKFVP